MALTCATLFWLTHAEMVCAVLPVSGLVKLMVSLLPVNAKPPPSLAAVCVVLARDGVPGCVPVASAIAFAAAGSASSRCQTAAKLDLNTPGAFGVAVADGSP